MKKKRYAGRWLRVWMLAAAALVLFTGTACSAPREDATYIWLVRHGRTYSNEQELLVGRGGNYDLTPEAQEAARAVGQELSTVEFDRAYSSTLGRTEETAALLLEGAGQSDTELTQLEDLDDISWGDAEGYTQQQFMETYQLDTFPDAFGNADDAAFVSPIGAETKYDFVRRFDWGIWQVILEAGQGEDVLVVSHSSMEFWLKWKFPELQNEGGIDNLGVTLLRVTQGGLEVVEYNKSFLEEEKE